MGVLLALESASAQEEKKAPAAQPILDEQFGEATFYALILMGE